MPHVTTYDIWSSDPEPARLAAGAGLPDLQAFPVSRPDAPAVVVMPGGGYVRHADHEGVPLALWLNELGVAAFVLRYRVAPARFPDPLDDGERAIRWVRRHAGHFGVDAERVGALGFSAGGHLAAMVSVGMPAPARPQADDIDGYRSRPDLAILCYAVLSGLGVVADNLLGPDHTQAAEAALDVTGRVDSQTPPTFLWHTADDGAVPVRNCLDHASALAAAGVPLAVHIFPHGRHGLGMAEEDPVVGRWSALAADWLGDLGWASNPEHAEVRPAG